MHPVVQSFNMLLIFHLMGTVTGNKDGDLRLLHGHQRIYGLIQDVNKTVSFYCDSQRHVIQDTRPSCARQTPFKSDTPEALPGQPTKTMCPYLWAHCDGNCYRYVGQAGTWQEGRTLCRNIGGDLARISNKRQNDFVGKMIRGESAWFLLNDRRSEGHFEYSSTKQVPYTNWYLLQPDNGGIFAFGKDEDCSEMYSEHPYTWNDEKCSNAENHAVCSRENEKLYWLDDVRCTGHEQSLSSCPHGEWGMTDCDQDQAVTLTCSLVHRQAGNGSQEQINTSLSYRGRLQIYHAGDWRFVCDRNFGSEDAQVACRQLSSIPHLLVEYTSHSNGEPDGLTLRMTGCTSEGDICDKTQDGFFVCPGNTSVTCNKPVVLCPRDRYGDSCTGLCGKCLDHQCTDLDGSCSGAGCMPGYHGPQCDQACAPGSWGVNCSQQCGGCIGGACDVRDGSCVTDTCHEGYTGDRCQNICLSGKWGQDCLHKCGRCRTGTCDVISGRCQQDACEDGYTGILCDKTCPSGSWGQNCSQVCGKCSGNPCHVINGTCPSNMCREGYEGELCTKKALTNTTVSCDSACPKCLDNRCAFGRKSVLAIGCEEVTWVTPLVTFSIIVAALGTLMFIVQSLFLYRKYRKRHPEAWKEKDRGQGLQSISPNIRGERLQNTPLK